LTSTFQDRTGSIAGQSAIKAPCALATTANITLSGEQTIDGTLTAESRVLVKDQTDTTENGIYDTSSGAWTRALDFDGSRDAVKGCLVRVNGGTVAAGKVYACTATDPIVFDTSAISFTEWTVATTPTGVLQQLGSNIASASTVDLGAADSDYVTITGTTTITSFGSTTTRNHMWLKFTGSLTVTHNGTSLICPHGSNIVTSNGDLMEVIRISGGNWQVVVHHPVDQVLSICAATYILGRKTGAGTGAAQAMTPAETRTNLGLGTVYSYDTGTTNGTVPTVGSTGLSRLVMPDGATIQRNYATYSTNASLSTLTPYDDTEPQIGEGTEILSAAITPTSATNKIRWRFCGHGAASGSQIMTAALHIDGASSATHATAVQSPGANNPVLFILEGEHTPGNTSSHTYSIRVGPASGTMAMNGTSAAHRLLSSSFCTLVLEEIKA